MTYQEKKCHLENIPNAKRLSDAYVCLHVQDVKKLFLFMTTLTFSSAAVVLCRRSAVTSFDSFLGLVERCKS